MNGKSATSSGWSWKTLPQGTKWLMCFWGMAVLATYVIVPAIGQDQSYHQFADQRHILCLPHAWNVLSNLPIFFIGVIGIWCVASQKLSSDLLSYLMTFFVTVMLTGFGSAWYHYQPSNESLFYDRLPLSLALAALYVYWLGRWQSRQLLHLFVPILLISALTVLWWRYTESRGVGDLRAYGLVQFGALLSAPIIVETSHHRLAARQAVYPVLLMYVVAKLCETFDAQILQLGNMVSGHALKHIFVAVAAAVVLYDVVITARKGSELSDK